jgi:hypothetical protein
MGGLTGGASSAVIVIIVVWLAGLTFWVWRLHGKLRHGAAEPWEADSSSDAFRAAGPESRTNGFESFRASARQDVQHPAEAARPPARSGLQPVEEYPFRAAPAPREEVPRNDAIADRVVSDFNRLAVNFTPEMLSQFEDRWEPRAVGEEGEGRLAVVSGGPLWFVLTDQGEREGVILPGAEIVRKWEKFYRNLGGVNAPAGLDASYSLVEGRVLAVVSPARGREMGGAIAITAKGELAGT